MVALGDASSKLACYDGMRYGHHADGRNLSEMYKKSRMEGFGEEVRKRILVGTCILTRGYYENYFVPATKVRQLISDEFKNLFRSADFALHYGLLMADGPLAGLTVRAVIVIDEEGKIVYTQLVREITDEPDYDAALSALK